MQQLGRLLFIFASLLQGAYAFRKAVVKPSSDDSSHQPATIKRKFTNGVITVTMNSTDYSVKGIYNTMKDIRMVSKALREEMQKQIRNKDKDADFDKVFDMLPGPVKHALGVGVIMTIWVGWWLDAKNKHMNGERKPQNKPAEPPADKPAEPPADLSPLARLLYLAFGNGDESVEELVGELIQNLLNMKHITNKYKLSPSQHAELAGYKAGKAMQHQTEAMKAREQTKRQEQMKTLSGFMRDLQGISNPIEVLESWQAPFKLPFYYLGAMVHELVYEAEMWEKLDVQGEPGAE